MGMSRSENMRRIRSKDTLPERVVRVRLRELGFAGYRLHRKDLPGCPDVAYIGKRRAIFVHGCFWHGHDCKVGSRQPKSNPDYWGSKIMRNRARDAEAIAQLEAMGWRVLVAWECETKHPEQLSAKLSDFMNA